MFDAPITYIAPGMGLSSVAVADLDGDGHVDLIGTGWGGANDFVRVMRGKGDGTFMPPLEFPVGAWAWGLAVGDLNGDGRTDAVVSNWGDGTISVLLGTGAGTFGPARNHVAGAASDAVFHHGPLGVTMADFDRDGQQDLAAALPDSGVIVWLGNGDGTLGLRRIVQAGLGGDRLVAADFNADGVVDIAMARPQSGVAVLLGRGDGTFDVALLAGEYLFPEDLAVGDLNRDGRLDIVTANGYLESVGVLLGNGDGTFAPAPYLGTGPVGSNVFASAIAIADFNRDGFRDLAVSDQEHPWTGVFLGNGDGTFGRRIEGTTYATDHLVVADFDADGFADLAGIGQCGVMLGNGDGTFGSTIEYATGSYPVSLASADLNRDGRPDLVTANAGTDSLSIRYGTPYGSLGPRIDVGAGPSPVAVDVEDLDGDGWQDLRVVSECSDLRVIPGTGPGGFGQVDDATAGLNLWTPATGDLNQDGRTDVVAPGCYTFVGLDSIHVLLSDGRFAFTKVASYPTAFHASALAVGDLDGDGRADVVGGDFRGSTVWVFPGNGDGSLGIPTYLASGSNARWIGIRDLNGDGRPDLLSGGYRKLSVWRGPVGSGLVREVELPWGMELSCAAIADFDGDGDLDIAFVSMPYGMVTVLLQDGLGGFASQSHYGIPIFPSAMIAADANGDGAPDLIATEPEGDRVIVLVNRGFNFPVPVEVSLVSAAATPGRVRLDWFVADGAEFNAVIYHRTASEEWKPLANLRADGAGHILFEDDNVAPGRSSYRLGYRSDPAQPERFSTEVTVEVPRALTFALEQPTPNPTLRMPDIGFTLPGDGPAALELLDVAGRVLSRREVGGLGIGRHEASVAGGERLPAGLYFVRLMRSHQALMRRLVILQ